MKIDLCKLLGVEEGEEFKIEYEDYTSDRVHKIDDNTFYVLCEDKFLKDNISVETIKRITKIIKLPKKKKFSQDTLNFFKMIDKKYKWIAKDKSGDIFGFEEKPKKDKYVWLCEEYDYCLDNTCCIDGLNQSLFNEILWEDEEPIYIDDYVER